MLVNSGAAYGKVLGQGIHIQGMVRQHMNNFPAGGIGYGLKYVSSHTDNYATFSFQI
jgi:hypothetical protein